MVIDEPGETPTAKSASAVISENDRDEDRFPSVIEVEDTLHDCKSPCSINFKTVVAGAESGGSPSGSLSANFQTANHDDPVSEILRVGTARSYHRASPKRDNRKTRKANSEPESSVIMVDDDDDSGGSGMSDTFK